MAPLRILSINAFLGSIVFDVGVTLGSVLFVSDSDKFGDKFGIGGGGGIFAAIIGGGGGGGGGGTPAAVGYLM